MAFDADQQLLRRRLKRRLTFWRLIAVLALAAMAVLILRSEGRLPESDHIARLTVSGIILDNHGRSEVLARVAKDPSVRALIVHINSPGGTVVGGEALFHALRSVAANKPVVAVMGEMATSAGYMVALGADRIFAREGSLTGSIGVILQTTNVTGLLKKLGITTEALKSGPLKAVPNPLEPLTPEVRQAAMIVIRDMFNMFVRLVAERRAMTTAEVLRLADGRVFTGHQAVAVGLIDAIGAEGEAVGWLAKARGIDETLPIRDLRLPEEGGILPKLVSAVTGKTLFSERVTLDGLISLWHPDLM